MTISLVSVVATKDYMEPTLKAIRKSLFNYDNFDDVVIICPKSESVPHEFIEINVDFAYSNYSRFMLKELHKYIDTDFCLTIQWDSCILDSTEWNDEFLNYDYIGPVWTHNWINRVGNGGFSLRSRKFLQECSNLHYYKQAGDMGNEDYFACVMCYGYIKEQGIKFAPVELARRFGIEYSIPEEPHNYNDLSTYKSFGFHGEFNKAGMEYINEK